MPIFSLWKPLLRLLSSQKKFLVVHQDIEEVGDLNLTDGVYRVNRYIVNGVNHKIANGVNNDNGKEESNPS